MKHIKNSKTLRGTSMLIGVAMGVATAGANASGELIGEVIAKGSATIGNGMTAIRITDSVFPYRAGEMIRSAEGGEVIIRLNEELGSVYVQQETTVTVNQNGDTYQVDGKGTGLRYLFKSPAVFNVVFDCFEIKPAGNAPEYAGSVWRDNGATMVQSVRANFDVQVTTDQTMRVSDGETHRGCQKGGAIKVASHTPVSTGTSLGNWALGAGVTILGAIGSSSSSAGATDSGTTSTTSSFGSTSTSATSVSAASSSAVEAPKAPASAKPEKPSAVIQPVAAITPSNGVSNGGGTTTKPNVSDNGGSGIQTPADPTSKPASPVKGGSSGGGKS